MRTVGEILALESIVLLLVDLLVENSAARRHLRPVLERILVDMQQNYLDFVLITAIVVQLEAVLQLALVGILHNHC